MVDDRQANEAFKLDKHIESLAKRCMDYELNWADKICLAGKLYNINSFEALKNASHNIKI